MSLFATAAQKAARSEYTALLTKLASSELERTPDLLPAIRSSFSVAALDAKKSREMRATAVRALVDRALADDVLDEREEEALLTVMVELGFSEADFTAGIFPGLMERLVVARVNDGRPPVLDDPLLMVKRGEVVHLEMAATLTKEVTIREYRGGYGGVSFKIAPGVRYHTGAVRGRSVVVGTKRQPADTGYLSITSQRAVFAGTRKNLEHRYDRLVNMTIYSDGLGLAVTNRQNTSIILVPSPHAAAALINYAAQQVQ